ncbi:MAG: phosphate ABC transporter permease subunit PstC [bacterium]
MSLLLHVLVISILAGVGFGLGYRRAWSVSGGHRAELHSLPAYHGLWVALWTFLPAFFFVQGALLLEGPLVEWLLRRSMAESGFGSSMQELSLALARVRAMAADLTLFDEVDAAERAAVETLARLQGLTGAWIDALTPAVAVTGLGYAFLRVSPAFRARNRSEQIIMGLLLLCSLVAILTTAGIIFALLSEALQFFRVVSPIDFFLGLSWSPQTAIRAGQVAADGAFGVVPVLLGTVLISLIAMCVAAPIGLFSAIYTAELADPRVRGIAKPTIEILAGIPTVVYGFFAAATVAPQVRRLGHALGLDVSSESALAAGSVMGIMIIPFVSSLSDDVIKTVPDRLREGAYSLGATRAETILRVVLPAALPGLLSAMVLAVSRALGETMIVVMAAGVFANLTLNPFEAVTTVTVQITSVLTGDQPFDSPTTLSAFALGLTLFFATLLLNLFALRVMERYRERYD